MPDISEVTIIGGRPRQVSVDLDPAALAARGLDPLARPAGARPRQRPRGRAATSSTGNRATRLEAGELAAIGRARCRTSSSARAAARPVASRRRRGGRATAAASRPTTCCYHPRRGEAFPAVTLVDRQAQGHQRHRADARASTQKLETLRGYLLPARPAGHRHAQLRRDGGAEVERAALAHVPRGHLGVGPHLARARPARVGSSS